MEFPTVWFVFSAVMSVAVTLFLLWLAWLMVSSIKGMHDELRQIRQLLEKRS